MSIDYINKLTENLKIDKPIKLNIVLDGGSFNGGYLYGSLLYLKHLEKNNKIIINKISGCSVGALMSVLYILDKLEITENEPWYVEFGPISIKVLSLSFDKIVRK